MKPAREHFLVTRAGFLLLPRPLVCLQHHLGWDVVGEMGGLADGTLDVILGLVLVRVAEFAADDIFRIGLKPRAASTTGKLDAIRLFLDDSHGKLQSLA